MTIGILKEKSPENRVALLPEALSLLSGFSPAVLVETGSGSRARASDEQYLSLNCTIIQRKEVIERSDLLLVVNPPETEDFQLMKPRQVIIGAFNPLSNTGIVPQMAKTQITVFSLDLVPRISRAQSMDILSSMATVSGYRASLDAALHLPVFFPMFMTAAGTIKPAKVLILGAGVTGLQAIATCRKLGAIVEAFDVRSAVKEEVQSLGAKFVEVEGAVEDKSAGGYAVEQTEEFKQKQSALIQEHAIKSDVVICTAQIPGRQAPLLVKKETVAQMKPGSVIVDLAASTGGNCELTEDEKTIEAHGVTIIGKTNYPSEMPVDASRMYGKNIVNFLKLLVGSDGNLNLNFEDEIIRGACLVHQGEVVNERVRNLIDKG